MFVRIHSIDQKVLGDLYWNIKEFFVVNLWCRTMCVVRSRMWWPVDSNQVVINFRAPSIVSLPHLVIFLLANHYIQIGKSRFSLATDRGSACSVSGGSSQGGEQTIILLLPRRSGSELFRCNPVYSFPCTRIQKTEERVTVLLTTHTRHTNS